jgi:ElaB/YqjD/DUF883 family membrane-anchored ribosome-binding protein
MARQKNATSETAKADVNSETEGEPAEANPNEEIVAIEEMMDNLEKRLQKLNASVKRDRSGAAGDVSEFIDDALGGVTERLREHARTLAYSMTDDAAQVGAETLRRIGQEIDHRPFALLGVAAGVGFLVGLGLGSRRS